MSTFNTLLRSADIDPQHVKLARHADRRGHRSPYCLWTLGDGSFDCYQKIQKTEVFKGAKILASFVSTEQRETLFVGLYEIGDRLDTVPPGKADPVSGKDVGGNILYRLALVPELEEYRGKLTIEWGRAYLRWVQLARNQDKTVLKS